MKRQTLSASITVDVEDGVTPEMVRAILVNNVYFLMSETQGGHIYWDRAKVFVGGGQSLVSGTS